jgi:membrane associated rhomboid family serine protease
MFLFNQPESVLAGSWIVKLFAVPAFIPSLLLKPWTLVSYMFLHVEIWHLLFNMLWLFWFGRIFMEFLTSRQLVTVYLLGGIAGALVYILAFNIFPVFSDALHDSYALGASASVMAIVTAISFHVPSYAIQLLFLGRVKILYLAIILFVFDFFMIPTGNAGGHLAHIGGALFGFIYISFSKSGAGSTFRSDSATAFNSFFNKFGHPKTGSGNTGQHRRPMSDEEYNARKVETQKRIDEILEKISKGGYDSLTKAEKEFLFRTSSRR